MNELHAILAAITTPALGGRVLCTLVHTAGSSYRRPGARMLVLADGTRIGSISGGCLEEDAIARAVVVARTGRAELVVYDTTSENDLVWGVGLGCHGVVQVLLEKLPAAPAWAHVAAENLRASRPTPLAVVWKSDDPALLGTHLAEALPASRAGTEVFHDTLPPPVPLIIFGAGDDALPLVRFAKDLGWHVTVGDARPAFATGERFPLADHVPIVRPEEPLSSQGIALGPQSVVVVMTHHYVHDKPLLRQLLPQPLAYLGLLGPKKRAEQIVRDLAAEGAHFTAAQLSRLRAPVGLDLGGEAAGEIALSIVAEIRAVLAGRDARPLREREGPIHG